MTKKTFESGDVIGRYTIDEFGGTDGKGEPFWWVRDENGKPQTVREMKLRKELRSAELTPQIIHNLSSRTYEELRKEIGDDGIQEIMNTRKPKAEVPANIDQREIAAK